MFSGMLNSEKLMLIIQDSMHFEDFEDFNKSEVTLKLNEQSIPGTLFINTIENGIRVIAVIPDDTSTTKRYSNEGIIDIASFETESGAGSCHFLFEGLEINTK